MSDFRMPPPMEIYEMSHSTDKRPYKELVDKMIADGLNFWEFAMSYKGQEQDWHGWEWGEQVCTRLFRDRYETIWDAIQWKYEQQQAEMN